jgi:hypothetical protein
MDANDALLDLMGMFDVYRQSDRATIDRAPAEERLLVIKAELDRLQKQVTELQQHGTLREEQLRAYRRLVLPKDQLERLKCDLEDTTRRVLEGYGLRPMHEIPLPRAATGV